MTPLKAICSFPSPGSGEKPDVILKLELSTAQRTPLKDPVCAGAKQDARLRFMAGCENVSPYHPLDYSTQLSAEIPAAKGSLEGRSYLPKNRSINEQ